MMPEESFNLDNKEDLEQLKEEIRSAPDADELHINRVPQGALDEFKDLANEQFAGDYGMTLAYLLRRENLRDDLFQVTKTNRMFIDQLAERLDIVEDQLSDEANEESEGFKPQKRETLQS